MKPSRYNKNRNKIHTFVKAKEVRRAYSAMHYSGPRHTYILSFDGERFYKIYASNERDARLIAGKIGQNPIPDDPTPPLGKSVLRISTTRGRAYEIDSVTAKLFIENEMEIGKGKRNHNRGTIK